MARDEQAFAVYATEQMTERIALEEKSNPASSTSPTDSDAKALAPSQPRKDMAHYLIHAIDPLTNAGFTRSQLDADASLLIAAGAGP
jgi:hypothetical protein